MGGFLLVWQAGCRHGCGAKEKGRGLNQPVAWSSENWADFSVHTGRYKSWKFWGGVFSRSKCMAHVGSFWCVCVCVLSFPQLKSLFANGETTELSGKCIVNLAKGGILCFFTWQQTQCVLPKTRLHMRFSEVRCQTGVEPSTLRYFLFTLKTKTWCQWREKF